MWIDAHGKWLDESDKRLFSLWAALMGYRLRQILEAYRQLNYREGEVVEILIQEEVSNAVNQIL